MKKALKEVKVLETPATWICVDVDEDEAEVKARWLRKHNYSKSLSEEQLRREAVSVRDGKMTQLRTFKK